VVLGESYVVVKRRRVSADYPSGRFSKRYMRGRPAKVKKDVCLQLDRSL